MMMRSNCYWYSSSDPNQVRLGPYVCDTAGNITGPWHRVALRRITRFGRVVFWLSLLFGGGWLVGKGRVTMTSFLAVVALLTKSPR